MICRFRLQRRAFERPASTSGFVTSAQPFRRSWKATKSNWTGRPIRLVKRCWTIFVHLVKYLWGKPLKALSRQNSLNRDLTIASCLEPVCWFVVVTFSGEKHSQLERSLDRSLPDSRWKNRSNHPRRRSHHDGRKWVLRHRDFRLDRTRTGKESYKLLKGTGTSSNTVLIYVLE